MGKLFYQPDYTDEDAFQIWFQINADCYPDNKPAWEPSNSHAGMELVSGIKGDEYMIRHFGSFISDSDLLFELDIWYAEEQMEKDEEQEIKERSLRDQIIKDLIEYDSLPSWLKTAK